MNIQQGNESNAKVVVLDRDGGTVHNVKRTVKNIINNGWYKKGQATIKGQEFNVMWNGKQWIGNN